MKTFLPSSQHQYDRGGTHLVFLEPPVTRTLNNYAQKKQYFQKGDRRSNYPVRMCARIDRRNQRESLTTPSLRGQDKGKVGNSMVKGIVDSVFSESSVEYLERNPTQGRRINEKSLNAARSREARPEGSRTYSPQECAEIWHSSRKIGRLLHQDPSMCELYLEEGDSAGGSAKQGRERRYIGHSAPMRCKILNVEKARID
jgi:DNA gyrase subunit B